MEKCVEALESGSTELHIEWYESNAVQHKAKWKQTAGFGRNDWLNING